MPDEPTKEPEKPQEPQSRLGAFLTKYATLVSSTVLGVAGLSATSIWQCRQSSTAEEQSMAQQKVAQTQAENSWKIERADILSKNIGTLAANGPDTVDQRYGVLLSLTRGNFLDPELAVSYALELGKDNAEYMQSVLATVPNKDYARIARAFTESCEVRYGVSPAIDACTDKLAARSAGLAALIMDDAEITLAGGADGPLALLKDERPVQLHAQRMVALFTPLLTSLYEDRKWDAINKFIAYSPAAHLVAAFVLTAAHTGEFVTDEEAKQLKTFDEAQSKWLAAYVAGPTCDAECKSRSLSVMISRYAESERSYDAAARAILEAPRSQSGMAMSFLHTRLLWCQIDTPDLTDLRDRVLVPLATRMLTDPKVDPATRDAILAVVMLVPEPTADDTAVAPAWQAMVAAVDKGGDKSAHAYRDRRAIAAQQRANPPPKFKKLNFCTVPSAAGNDAANSPARDH
ncbi:MAG: hypothetical protein ABI704_17875 [Kofleriaceae bacterium]